MAFQNQNMSRTSGSCNTVAPDTFTYNGNTNGLTDSFATIIASNYFLTFWMSLSVGDLIWVVGSDTNGIVYVTASSNSSVTVANNPIANGSIVLADLATGIAPSHVVKFAGTFTWSGSGASLATTVTGVAATDIVVASFLVTPTQAAYIAQIVPTTNTITTTLSAANTGNDAQISYVVYRAAS